MEKVGMKEFEEPMKYRLGTNMVYSEKYIKETPLEVLKVKYNKIIANKDIAPINDVIESLEVLNRDEIFLTDKEKAVALDLLEVLEGQTVFRATAILNFMIKAIQFSKIK
jgi:hypothetical protein